MKLKGLLLSLLSKFKAPGKEVEECACKNQKGSVIAPSLDQTSLMKIIHDLQSPLTAFDFLSTNAESFETNEKRIMKTATQKLHEIVDRLSLEIEERSPQSLVDIPALVLRVVKEREFNKINIQCPQEENYYFSKTVEYKCKASILQALSSIKNEALIDITITAEEGPGRERYIVVTIQERELNTKQKGICGPIEIRFPKAVLPKNYLTKLQVRTGEQILVLDNDQSIHDTWEMIMRPFSVKLYHARTIKQASEILKQQKISLFLLDFDLDDPSGTGLDFAVNNKIQQKSIIVTSTNSKSVFIGQCLNEGVKVLPKSLLTNLSVIEKLSIGGDQKTNYYLLDDDPIVRSLWKISAKKDGVNLEVFSKAEEIYALDVTGENDFFYIDSDLGEGVSGVDIALELHKRGHQNIFMATGHTPEQFKGLEYIKGVTGKRPPWHEVEKRT